MGAPSGCHMCPEIFTSAIQFIKCHVRTNLWVVQK